MIFFCQDILISELMRHFPTQFQSLRMLKENKTIAKAAQFLRQQDNISAVGLSRQEGGYATGNFNPYKKIINEPYAYVANRQTNKVSRNGPRSI